MTTHKDTIFISVPREDYEYEEVKTSLDRLEKWCEGENFSPRIPFLGVAYALDEPIPANNILAYRNLNRLRQCTHLVVGEGWDKSLECMTEVTAFLSWRDYRPERGTLFIEEDGKVNSCKAPPGTIEEFWELWARGGKDDYIEQVQDHKETL